MKQAVTILLLIIYLPVVVFASGSQSSAANEAKVSFRKSQQYIPAILFTKSCKPLSPQKPVPAKVKSLIHACSLSSDLPAGLFLPGCDMFTRLKGFETDPSFVPNAGNTIWQPPRFSSSPFMF